MIKRTDDATRLFRRSLPVALLLLQAGLWAQDLPALAAPAAPTAAPAPADPDKKARDGFLMTIESSAQGNFGALGIGAGYIGAGPYIDEKGARQNGLHANLSIAVDDAPDQFSQPSVREGQTLVVADYRIRVEQIDPKGRGAVVLRLWAPPKPPAKAKSGWRHFFGL